mmetsp:Transcript_30920/g.100672  ORF Transcript_30920/g.100672 Transcript_30920/m.100672 type:complete len:581 (-) Transcript_30920:91-1833(-)
MLAGQRLAAIGQHRARRSRQKHQVRAAIAEPVVTEAPTVATEVPRKPGGKQRVVVLGSGWGAVSFVQNLDPALYDVLLLSPRSFFVYTPLLPAVATHRIEDRSVVESIRKTLKTKGFDYVEAKCLEIDPEKKTVVAKVTTKPPPGEARAGNTITCEERKFVVDYDALVLAVGAQTQTFGIPGVEENCLFFKELDHVRRFREEVLTRFELASMPGISDERAQELLRFVVVGGGPTGVELAAELQDMIKEDLSKLFPQRLQKLSSVVIIDLQDFVLSTYDARIAEWATKHFLEKTTINLKLNAAVQEVTPTELVIKDITSDSVERMPYGLCVWATGIKMNPLCEQLKGKLPEQHNLRSLTTDKHLRVKGAPSCFALGDCATIERPRSLAHAERLFELGVCEGEECTVEQTVDLEGLRTLLEKGAEEFPHLEEVAKRADEEYAKLVGDAPGLTFEKFQALLGRLDDGLRALPATAQVAKQQGEYLAELLGKADGSLDTVTSDEEALNDVEYARFDYLHKGSLAYVGNDAGVLDIPGFTILRGFSAGLIWRGFETVSQLTLRNRLLVAGDFIRSKLFGRDISSV